VLTNRNRDVRTRPNETTRAAMALRSKPPTAAPGPAARVPTDRRGPVGNKDSRQERTTTRASHIRTKRQTRTDRQPIIRQVVTARIPREVRIAAAVRLAAVGCLAVNAKVALGQRRDSFQRQNKLDSQPGVEKVAVTLQEAAKQTDLAWREPMHIRDFLFVRLEDGVRG